MEKRTESSVGGKPPSPGSPGEPAPLVVRPFETVVHNDRRTGSSAAAPASHGSSFAELPTAPVSTIVRALFPARDAVPSEIPNVDGMRLGQFRIVERIRAGGMGSVFKAVDERLNRYVALKVLPPTAARDPATVLRFQNEAQSGAQFDHDNIARVFASGEEHGLHYIAFEYIPGRNLRELIADVGKVSVTDAVSYTLQIAGALVHSSSRDVVHRDIKPSNIIITPSGRAKLVDLGLAKKLSPSESDVELTSAGTTLGTFDYISPEQARDPRTADVRSDIYSLGCTLYHMLAGSPPYPEGTVLQKLLQHQGDEAPHLRRVNRTVPESLAAVCRKMMAKDPQQRYQSAEMLVGDLLAVADQIGLHSAMPEGLIWQADHSGWPRFLGQYGAWLFAATALLVIVGVIEFGSTFPDPASAPDNVGKNPKFNSTVATGDGASPKADNARADNTRADKKPSLAADKAPAAQRTSTSGQIRASTRSVWKELVSASAANMSNTSTTSEKTTPAHGSKSDPVVAVMGDESSDESVPLTGNLGPEPSGGSIGPLASSRLGPPLLAVGQLAVVDSLGSGAASSDLTANLNSAASSSTAPPTATSATVNSTEGPFALLFSGESQPRQSFASLQAACAKAVDESVIELRFDGVRTERPFRINGKRLVIRAARGYLPEVRFVREGAGEDMLDGMLTIVGGTVTFVGVDLSTSVPHAASSDGVALLVLQDPELVQIRDATLTLLNPRKSLAALFALRPRLGGVAPDMQLAATMARSPTALELTGVVLRSEGAILRSRDVDAARISFGQALIAARETAIDWQSAPPAVSAATGRVELRFDHVTAVLGNGLLASDSRDTARSAQRFDVRSDDSIFSALTDVPLVSLNGSVGGSQLRDSLVWTGRKNFYDMVRTFRNVQPRAGFFSQETLDFAGWKKSMVADVDPQSVGIRWKNASRTVDFGAIVPADYQLDANSRNADGAIGGASHGGNVGADITILQSRFDSRSERLSP